VIGAFCSVDWGKRPARQAYFGTGESFVCKLLPTCCCYAWVGLQLGENTPHAAQLFLSGDSSQISIGGGLVIHCSNVLTVSDLLSLLQFQALKCLIFYYIGRMVAKIHFDPVEVRPKFICLNTT